MADITITLRLFGAFRIYGETVQILLPRGSTVPDLKVKLRGIFVKSDPALIGDSAFADENAIIDDTMSFDKDAQLAILPPVCGG